MKKLKVTQIATKLQVTHSAVSQWFNGKNKPNLKHIEMLEKYYEIPPNAWYNFIAYKENNSERFRNITTPQRQHNGNTKV